MSSRLPNPIAFLRLLLLGSIGRGSRISSGSSSSLLPDTKLGGVSSDTLEGVAWWPRMLRGEGGISIKRGLPGLEIEIAIADSMGEAGKVGKEGDGVE